MNDTRTYTKSKGFAHGYMAVAMVAVVSAIGLYLEVGAEIALTVGVACATAWLVWMRFRYQDAPIAGEQQDSISE